jgi:hypothetical protein
VRWLILLAVAVGLALPLGFGVGELGFSDEVRSFVTSTTGALVGIVGTQMPWFKRLGGNHS